MTKQKQDFEMYAGSTKRIFVTVTDPDTGNAIDLTESTVEWTLTPSWSTTPAIQKDTSAGITLTAPSNGEFRVSISPSDTEGLSGSFDHQATVTDAMGNPSPVLVGRVTIHESDT